MGREPLGRYYQVDDRRLLVNRSGAGSPAVVFVPGGGAVGLDYWNVYESTSKCTTSVLYDRAGTGWSDAADLPRSSTQVTDELRRILHAADVPPPYVVVGHSLGGLYARRYAQRFAEDVVGLLLLDPAHEEYDAFMPPRVNEVRSRSDADMAIPDEFPEFIIEFYRALFTQEMAEWPAHIREPLVDCHVSQEWLHVGIAEVSNVAQLYDEVRHGGPLPNVPLIVLCSTGIDDFKRAVSFGESEEMLQGEIEGKRRLYRALARSVPGGEIRDVDTGHVTMHLRRPDVVQQAIDDILTAVRV